MLLLPRWCRGWLRRYAGIKPPAGSNTESGLSLAKGIPETSPKKVQYDAKHDIAYIRFSQKNPDGAIEIDEGVVLDTTAEDEIVGIEIFDAARRLPIQSLFQAFMARLDRLGSAKGLAQLGATPGRQFSYAVLQAASQLDAATLQRELDEGWS
jgi:uncharacterized protein YuzE